MSAADRLRRALPAGTVHTEGAAYDDTRRLWNGAVERRPAVVVRPTEADQVPSAVRAARELGLPISVRGGGHGWSGSSLVDGGVTLDLRELRAVTVTGDGADIADIADVGGGATSLDVATAAGAHGLVATTGTAGAVGMVGLALGGGYGPLSGALGLAVDSVVEVDLVLADGTAVTASADHEPELFWAVRGGGGNLGVVTGMRLRLHRVPSLLSGMAFYPLDQAADILTALADTLVGGPDELTVQAGVITAPTGHRVLFLAPTWCGDPAAGERAVADVTGLGEPVFSQVGPAPQADTLAATDALFPVGRHVELRPRSIRRLTPEVVDLLVEHGGTATSPWSAVSLHSLHGAATRVPAGATAYGVREPHLVVESIAVWEADDPEPDAHRAWVRGLADALGPHAMPGTYANLLGDDEPDLAAHAYGDNAARLLAAKRTHDPDGVFRSIPLPAARP